MVSRKVCAGAPCQLPALSRAASTTPSAPASKNCCCFLRTISCLHPSGACATVSLAGSFEVTRPTGAVGSPPREYALPFGWCRFNLRVNPRLEAGTMTKKWHMAYHGSNVAAIRRVLDRGELGAGTASILSCRPLKGKPGVGFEEPGENCAPPREEQPLRLAVPLPPVCWGRDPSVQSAIPGSQVPANAPGPGGVPGVRAPGLLHPGPPSATLREPPDPHFSPAELEWITKEKGATLLYALLVRVE